MLIVFVLIEVLMNNVFDVEDIIFGILLDNEIFESQMEFIKMWVLVVVVVDEFGFDMDLEFNLVLRLMMMIGNIIGFIGLVIFVIFGGFFDVDDDLLQFVLMFFEGN